MIAKDRAAVADRRIHLDTLPLPDESDNVARRCAGDENVGAREEALKLGGVPGEVFDCGARAELRGVLAPRMTSSRSLQRANNLGKEMG